LLLFFVLFYVYPLKFLFGLMLGAGPQIAAGDARKLFVIYGAGYAAVFLVLSLLYLHAWRRREELKLDPLERLKTWRSLMDHSVMVLIGLTSVVLAAVLPLRWIGFAGYFYFRDWYLLHLGGSACQKASTPCDRAGEGRITSDELKALFIG
jgi:hypothetical protein